MKDALFTEAPSSAGLLGKTRARSDASCAAFVVINLAAAVDSADASLLHSVARLPCTCTHAVHACRAHLPRTHARAHLPCTPAVHTHTMHTYTCRAHLAVHTPCRAHMPHAHAHARAHMHVHTCRAHILCISASAVHICRAHLPCTRSSSTRPRQGTCHAPCTHPCMRTRHAHTMHHAHTLHSAHTLCHARTLHHAHALLCTRHRSSAR